MNLWREVEVAVKQAAAKTKEGLETQIDNGKIKRIFFWREACLFRKIFVVCVW